MADGMGASRRSFLKLGGAVALASTLNPVANAAEAQTGKGGQAGAKPKQAAGKRKASGVP